MSGALIVAAVTVGFKDFLENKLVALAPETGISDVKVSTLSPDRINLGTEEPNQINLFLYRVSPNASLRKEGSTAKTATMAPAISLDLFYLITVYGSEPLTQDILFGCAMSALRELNSDTLKAAIPTLPTQSQKKDQRPTSKRVAISVDIVNRQTLKVMPQFLSMEDLSRLWSSLQAKYRPSIAYQISGVLIE